MEKGELIEQLKLLTQIQEIDLECKDIQTQIDEIPHKISRWQNELKNSEEEINREKKEMENLILERKEKELEMDSNQETLKKYQAQLYTVKTNKEYSSLLHEIEEIKRKNSHLEDDILELMEIIDSKEEKIREKREKLKEMQREFMKKEQQEKQRDQELRQRLNMKKGEREKVSVHADRTLLAKYERISKGKNHLAIVPIKDNSCGGCHLQLPPQKVSEIKSASKTITCEGCARILYWEDNLK